MMRFKDKVVIVTGGAMGIGKAICESFAREGAKVVIGDINEVGQAVSDELNSQGLDTFFVSVDVAKEVQVKSLIEATVNKYGKLDIMCANAGVTKFGLPLDHEEKDIDYLLDVNVKGVFFSDKYAVEQMLKQGHGGIIINSGSIGSFTGRALTPFYTATKGAVKLLTQSFAKAYSSDGIRVNAVCPGGIETEMISKLIQNDEHRARVVADHPIGRLGTPQEAANIFMFLASEESSYMIGHTLIVDGGFLA